MYTVNSLKSVLIFDWIISHIIKSFLSYVNIPVDYADDPF